MTTQIINQTIPQEYKQYQEIKLCGNILKNIKYLVDDDSFFPVLIGRGEIPRIWVYTKKESNAIVVVKDSVAVLPSVKIDIFSREKKISLEFTQLPNSEFTKFLEIDYSDDMPSINYIDLRPLGYKIHGDKSSLTIGEQAYSDNVYENSYSLVKIENNNR